VSDKLIAFGEIGLGGELRNISHITQRLSEAERMGFDKCIVPKQSLKGVDLSKYNMKICGVTSIKKAFDEINA